MRCSGELQLGKGRPKGRRYIGMTQELVQLTRSVLTPRLVVCGGGKTTNEYT